MKKKKSEIKFIKETSDPMCRVWDKLLEHYGVYLLNIIDYILVYNVLCKKLHIYKKLDIQKDLKCHCSFLAKMRCLSEFWELALETSKPHVIYEVLHY